MSVDVGMRLIGLAQARGARSLAVVGTMKNAGKTVTFGAICEALARAGTSAAVLSSGRDGEARDAVAGIAKPPVRLAAGSIFATAIGLVPAYPAAEMLAVTAERSALGRLVIARAVRPCKVELVGPATATALRRIVAAVAPLAAFVVIDGAIDRIAALRDGEDAIVVAVGAPERGPVSQALDGARALVRRLGLPPPDAEREMLAVETALTLPAATAYARAGERRQIVVRDATRIAFGGRAFLALADRLDLRAVRALAPVACTVAPAGVGRPLEPRAFLAAVAEATGLPAFDVFAALAGGSVA